MCYFLRHAAQRPKEETLLKLRKVEIVGFKSFCERTVVTFSGSGTTCIVGPNGCGKSNVVDAISWVLGEQSHKSLRAERMADCIFNGTVKRPPLGLAEVTITMEDPELAEAARFVLESAEIQSQWTDGNAPPRWTIHSENGASCSSFPGDADSQKCPSQLDPLIRITTPKFTRLSPRSPLKRCTGKDSAKRQHTETPLYPNRRPLQTPQKDRG